MVLDEEGFSEDMEELYLQRVYDRLRDPSQGATDAP
jgi:hypothetical protein